MIQVRSKRAERLFNGENIGGHDFITLACRDTCKSFVCDKCNLRMRVRVVKRSLFGKEIPPFYYMTLKINGKFKYHTKLPTCDEFSMENALE